MEIYRAPRLGSNVWCGEDISSGRSVLAAQTFLRPAELGVLASVGKAQVLVYQRPRVAILATGDEIIDPGEPYKGKSSIATPMSRGRSLRPVAVCSSLELPWMDRAIMSQRIASGLRADVLITSGGVSVGSFDYVRECLDAFGFQARFACCCACPAALRLLLAWSGIASSCLGTR